MLPASAAGARFAVACGLLSTFGSATPRDVHGSSGDSNAVAAVGRYVGKSIHRADRNNRTAVTEFTDGATATEFAPFDSQWIGAAAVVCGAGIHDDASE